MTDGGPAKFFIPLSSGGTTVVSKRDYSKVVDENWRLGANGYVYRVGGRLRGQPVLLHRIVLEARPGEEIHHRNGNKLDNRRDNLELCSAKEHQEHHKHIVITRNKATRKYPTHRVCLECHKKFLVHRDHRGRNRFCSKLCGNRYMGRLRRK